MGPGRRRGAAGAAGHAAFFLDLAERARPWFSTPDQDRWLSRFRAESANIRASCRWFGERGEPGSVVRMGWALWPFWWQEGHLLEGAGWMEDALRRGDLLDDHDRANASTVLGLLSFGLGDYQSAAPNLRRGAELSRRTANPFGLGMALALGGVIAAVQGSVSEAEESLAGARAAFEAADDPWGLSFADYTLGRMLLLSGRNDEALSVLERSVAGARQVGEKTLLALTLINLGWSRLAAGDLTGATGVLRESLDLIVRLHNRIDAARAIEGLAAAAAAGGAGELGAQLFGAAEGVRRTIGVGVWLPDLPTHQRTEQALVAMLGHDRFERCFSAGTRLSAGDALELAGSLST